MECWIQIETEISSHHSNMLQPDFLQDKSGSGSLVKLYCIRHWLELTSDSAHEQVQIALRDGAFNHGPWGEPLSQMKFLFVDSTVNLTPLTQADGTVLPANQEATISINWQLPLDGKAQGFLFERIRKTFEKATAIIDSPQDRKRYRLSEEELLSLRNLMCLWIQIKDFCSSRISNFQEFDAAIRNGNAKDHELQALLDSRPAQFGISMLPSSQREALEAVRQQEEGQSLEVEKERLAVRDARWAFFQGALKRDQEKFQLVEDAPTKIAALRHRKQMQWRLNQATQGEKVIKAYRDKFLRCELVAKPELAQQKINEFRTFVVPCFQRLNVFNVQVPFFQLLIYLILSEFSKLWFKKRVPSFHWPLIFSSTYL